ncbi:MAG: DUF433 domain-containing protein [Acidobacteria bacterium]|nr:DUF433 domain-containing protein [Acidobacteriota bacterium]
MIRLDLNQTPPLVQEDDGTVRIIGSRVTLDTIVGAYKRGDTPQEIEEGFPSLSIRQIYGAIAYYLEHEAETEAYLKWRKEEGEAIRREIESDQDTIGFRERLRKRVLERESQLTKSH